MASARTGEGGTPFAPYMSISPRSKKTRRGSRASRAESEEAARGPARQPVEVGDVARGGEVAAGLGVDPRHGLAAGRDLLADHRADVLLDDQLAGRLQVAQE